MLKQKLALFCLFIALPGLGHAASSSIPAGFNEQLLAPTTAKVMAPVDWYYNRAGLNEWIISKEDTSKNQPYFTGMKISFLEPKKYFREKGKDWIASVYELKKKNYLVKVLDECKQTSVGSFEKVCIETEEGENKYSDKSYHVIYSAYWPDDGKDLLVVTKFMAPASEWKNVKSLSETMERFDPAGAQIVTHDP